MNQLELLIKNFQTSFAKDINNYLFRISMESDLDRVKKFGSTRIGLSEKLWDKLDSYPKEQLPKYPILHQEIIIASYWQDLIEDAQLLDGTLAHKLKIYSNPFFTVYSKEKLLEIGKEDSLGKNNQGRHFFFLSNPINCLDSLWQIEPNQTEVKEILWK